MSAENVAATGIRFPARPARSSVAIATTLSRPNAEYTASNDSEQQARKTGMQDLRLTVAGNVVFIGVSR